MRNWKTTLGGILLALGQPLQVAVDPTVHAIGQVLAIIGALFLGASAKDYNVSHTQPK